MSEYETSFREAKHNPEGINNARGGYMDEVRFYGRQLSIEEIKYYKKKTIMVCRDYLVSGGKFNLKYDAGYQMFVTSLVPELNKLSEYYKSEKYISHTDGKSKALIDNLYVVARKILLKIKLKLVERYCPKIEKQNVKILDYGCGTGGFLKICEDYGYDVEGIEPSEEAVNIAKQKIKGNILTDTNLDAIDKNKFHIITLWHVLEHIPNLKETISNLKRILKNDGTLIIAVPNYKSFDARYYKEFWAGYDVPRHLWHFSKESIKMLFSEVNMEIIKIKPMWLDSFYVSMLSEKYKKSKLGIVRAFFIGGISNFFYLLKKQSSSHIYVIKNKIS